MNSQSTHQDSHCDRGCHSAMNQLTQAHKSFAVGRVAAWLGVSLLSFIVFLFVLGRMWPSMNAGAGQGVLALLALGAATGVMVAARKCSQIWQSIRLHRRRVA